MNTLKVFLSYSHADKIVARRVVRRLIEHGIQTWLDERELRLGAVLTPSLRTHIENADVLLVIASHHSAESLWVKMELDFAKEHDKTIIPIFTEQLSTHHYFKDNLGVDACSLQSFAENIDNLVHSLYGAIELEVPLPDRDILTSHLRELAKEEPNLAPLIIGCLDSVGLHYENIDTVFSVSFHKVDESLNALFELYPTADIASCVAYGFNKTGAGTKSLFSWIKMTGDGELPIVTAVGTTLVPELIPTAIKLLETCSPPNNHATYSFIDNNSALLTDSLRRSAIRLVTWPVRSDPTRYGDVLAWVALKHFPLSAEIQQVWVRWINGGAFDGKPEHPSVLAHHLSRSYEEQLEGWEPINESLRAHVREYLRSRNKEKVNIALDHVMEAAEKTTPVLYLLLRETNGVSATAEWNEWRKTDPDNAELMHWLVHFISEEASGDKNWIRAWENTRQMIEFEKERKQNFQKKNDDNYPNNL